MYYKIPIKLRYSIALRIYRPISLNDNAIELQDVLIWVDYFSTLYDNSNIVRNKTLDMLRSSGRTSDYSEYNCRYRKDKSKRIEDYGVNDGTGELRYYFLMLVDNVDEDVINKIFFESLNLKYVQDYDIGLVDMIRYGFKQKEIAEMFGVTEGYISQLIAKARKWIK